MKCKWNRNRVLYGVLIILTIILGISSRKFSRSLPDFIAGYAGDTLWALMVFFIIAFIFNKSSIIKVATKALLFSYFIEISQLYQAEWINNIRSTTLGGLVLGFGFLWSDLICYTVGITLGVVFDNIISSLKRN